MINWTELIIGIASIIVTAVLVPLLREKSKQIKTETLNYWLRTLMSAAETYFSDGEGKQKKQWVIDRVQEHLKGLDVAELEAWPSSQSPRRPRPSLRRRGWKAAS